MLHHILFIHNERVHFHSNTIHLYRLLELSGMIDYPFGYRKELDGTIEHHSSPLMWRLGFIQYYKPPTIKEVLKSNTVHKAIATDNITHDVKINCISSQIAGDYRQNEMLKYHGIFTAGYGGILFSYDDNDVTCDICSSF